MCCARSCSITCFFRVEAFTTGRAYEWFKASVHCFMSFKFSLGIKPFVANITDERSSPKVVVFMTIQVHPANEPFLTFLTFIRFKPIVSMSEFVFSKGFFSVESFQTFITNKRSIARVFFFMLHKVTFIQKVPQL